jgi:hypothetical protein
MPSLIGNKPNQVPTNADLGTLAFQDANAVNITGGTASLTSVASPSVTNAGTLALSATGANAITASTNGAVRATVDANGNLGLGVTPSPWSTYRALQINGVSSIAASNTDLEITSGAYFNSGWKYASNAGGATRYSQQENAFSTHAWYVAPSGTTGNDVTFTEVMRLNASGNLIQSAPATPPTLTTNGQMVFNLTSNTNLRVSVRGSDGVTRTANITLA